MFVPLPFFFWFNRMTDSDYPFGIFKPESVIRLNQKKKGKGTNIDLYTQNTLMSNTNPLKTGVNSGAPNG
jgi:hypothetical protein